jgi:hypothetical protein
VFTGTAGTANRGIGGGASNYNLTGAAGGSGVVVLRHSNSFPQVTTTGSPTIVNSGGYCIYTFTGSGSFTF